MQTESTYSLELDRVKDALSILDSEVEALKNYLKSQQQLNKANFLVYIFFVSIATLFILANHNLLTFETGLMLGAAICTPLFLITTFYLFRGIGAFRQLRQEQRELALEPIGWFVDWKEYKVRLVLQIPVALGLIIFVISIFLRKFNLWIFDAGIVAYIIGLLVSSSLLAKRGSLLFETKLEEAERLRSSLLNRQTLSQRFGAEQSVSIPEEEYKQIARIERALIVRERRQAIKKSSKKPDNSVWAVQASASAMTKKSTLDDSARLMIQTRIDELTTNQQPADAHKDAEGFWRLPVPQTSLEISYTLLEDRKCIVIHALLEREPEPSGLTR
jgi:hypothetical protein